MSNEGTRPKPLSRASLMSTRATGCHRQLRLQLVSNFIICESDKWRNRRFSITQLFRNRRSFYKCSARGPDFSNGTCWQLRFMMALLHTLIIVGVNGQISQHVTLSTAFFKCGWLLFEWLKSPHKSWWLEFSTSSFVWTVDLSQKESPTF